MQHDHVLKKLKFDPNPRVRGLRGLQAKYLRSCCCIPDSLYFDMQHDIVLKKFNFDLLTPSPGQEGVCQQNIFYHVAEEEAA